MKRLPKYTPAEVRNDPYGFTYKEMSEVIGENEAKALYEHFRVFTVKRRTKRRKAGRIGEYVAVYASVCRDLHAGMARWRVISYRITVAAHETLNEEAEEEAAMGIDTIVSESS